LHIDRIRNRITGLSTSTRSSIDLLTGFLGAGKTTLLNALLADGQTHTAVIINEFGDIAIYHDLVVPGGDQAGVTTTGCVCCTAGSDIFSTLQGLATAGRRGGLPGFQRIVVETTGLADPAPIINQLLSLHDTGELQFCRAGVITPSDAECGATKAAPKSPRQSELCSSQWRRSNRTPAEFSAN
jgi:G3E family GTPase